MACKRIGRMRNNSNWICFGNKPRETIEIANSFLLAKIQGRMLLYVQSTRVHLYTNFTQAQKTISTEGTAILREQKKLQRSQSFTDHDLDEFGTPKAQKRKKKKHLSSNIAHMLLSPRRKSQQPQQPINQNCDKCEVLLDTFNSVCYVYSHGFI